MRHSPKRRLPLLFPILLFLTLTCSAGSDGYNEKVERAEKLAMEGDSNGAIKELRAAALQADGRAGAHIALGKLLMSESSEMAEARKALEAGVQAYLANPIANQGVVASTATGGFSSTTLPSLWANIATLRYQTRDPAGAADACKKALHIAPDHARCLYIYSVSCLSTGDWSSDSARVESSLKAAIKLFAAGEEKASAGFALGTFYLRRGELRRARAAFEASLKQQPAGYETMLRLGEVCSRMGEHLDALVAFQRAARVQPLSVEPLLQAGNALRRLKRFQEALETYERAQAVTDASDRDRAELRYQVGTVYEQEGRDKEARGAYKEAISLDRGHARALNNMASMSMAQGKPKEAVKLYKRAVEADPNMYEAHNNLGGLLLSVGRDSEAVSYLEKAIELEGSEPQVLFNLGLAYRRTGRGDEGVPLMRKAIQINPSNKDYFWELARTYNFQKERGLALSVLDGMTRLLRTGWGGITADADTYIHTLSPYLSFYQDSGKRVGTVGRSEEGARLESGVITFLCCGDETELVELHHALTSLAAHYTRRYPYPVVIFHDVLTTSNETSLVAAYGSASPLSFERIDFAFPEDMPASVREGIPKKLHLAGHAWGLGYRHMSRFFSNDFYDHAAMQGYEYYLRLDADSFLLMDVEEDIFGRMARKNKTYGYMVVTQEDEAVVKGLWDATQEYVELRKMRPKSLKNHQSTDGSWNRNMFYTNFEVSRLDFWRSEEYRGYFRHIDAKNGIYMHRWGDAPIHLLAVSLLLDDADIERFDHVPYWHQYYVNMPPAPKEPTHVPRHEL